MGESMSTTKKALCVGINDYPGMSGDLRGCVNDAHGWSTLLQSKGYDITLLLDDQATRANILAALSECAQSAGAGDLLAFTYSGHGSWVPDRGELDESDNRDETLAVYDGNILDDELRAILQSIDPEASMSIISDSCHSGTITRSGLRLAAERGVTPETPHPPKPRFLPPASDVDALAAFTLPVRRRALYPDASMNHILLTGCNALEYSYDAYFNGTWNGAMSFYALQLLQADPDRSWRSLHQGLRQLLPNTQHPQSPQLEGQDARKDDPVFG